MFNFGLAENEANSANDGRLEVMAALTRAWIERANSFDVLGRYESRLSRQLLKNQEEFERLQNGTQAAGIRRLAPLSRTKGSK